MLTHLVLQAGNVLRDLLTQLERAAPLPELFALGNCGPPEGGALLKERPVAQQAPALMIPAEPVEKAGLRLPSSCGGPIVALAPAHKLVPDLEAGVAVHGWLLTALG